MSMIRVGSGGRVYRCSQPYHLDYFLDGPHLVVLGLDPRIEKIKKMNPVRHEVVLSCLLGRGAKRRAVSVISECSYYQCQVANYWISELCRRVVHGDFPENVKERAVQLCLEVGCTT